MAPFTQDQLLRRVLKTEGMLPVISHREVSTELLMRQCEQTVENYSDWPQEQGFGSSDMTFVVQGTIDNIIYETGIPYQTTFNPMLFVQKQ